MRTRYGGLKRVKGTRSGFFHVEEIAGKHWLIDPDGGAFFAVGLCRVDWESTRDANGVAVYHENAKRRYGTQERWARAVHARLKSWHFNCTRPTAGAARSPRFAWCPASHTFAAKTKRLTAPGVPGYMTFVDIFDPAWEENYREVCAQRAAPNRRDPWLIGYYTDNELFWGTAMGPGRSMLDAVLHQQPDTHNKRELARWLKERYGGDLDALNRAWGYGLKSWDDLLLATELGILSDGILADKRAFLFHYAHRYFSVVDRELERADPNHLNLGCRVHGWFDPELAQAMGEFVDVISYNKYDGVAPVWQLDELHRITGRPTLLSEWGFRGMDTGHTNTGGVGRIVRTQAERGKRYAEFIADLARHPRCVGSIFYAYEDDPVTGGGGIMKNENSNYGLVDLEDRPYAACAKQVAKANKVVEKLRLAPAALDPTWTINTPKDFAREPLDRFVLQRHRRVVGHQHLRAFLLGSDQDWDAQAQTFEVDFARETRFAARVYCVEGAPLLEFALDGEVLAQVDLPAREGAGLIAMRMPNGWQSIYDREVEIRVPPGPRSLRVRNAGTGWIWLDCYRVR